MPFTGVITVPEPPPPPPPKYQLPALTLSRGDDVLHLPFTAIPGHIWCIGPGIEGLDQPASSLIEQRAAGQFGSYARGINVPAREIFLPLMVMRASYQQMLEERDAYNALTSPYEGHTVRITFTRPSGTQRYVDAFRAGPAVIWDRGTWIPRISWQKFGQVFTCPDPWWKGSAETLTWSGPDPQNFFPITPVRLTSSQILGDPRIVTVRGDTVSYPFFQICGPVESVTATHVESGRSWTFNASLEGASSAMDAECATIDTDPRVAAERPPVQGPDGSSWFSFLEPPYDLWSLPPGPQTVQIDATGAGPGTSIRMTLVAQWETA
jgi:hypothetical protein